MEEYKKMRETSNFKALKLPKFISKMLKDKENLCSNNNVPL